MVFLIKIATNLVQAFKALNSVPKQTNQLAPQMGNSQMSDAKCKHSWFQTDKYKGDLQAHSNKRPLCNIYSQCEKKKKKETKNRKQASHLQSDALVKTTYKDNKTH